MIKGHGRFAYEAITSRLRGETWPNGAKVAVYVAVNLEHFSFGEGLGGQLVPHTGKSPDVLNYSWREYGNRVGAIRLLEAFDELKIPTSALINGALAEHAPELIARHRDRGDEIVGHGWTNAEKQGDMDEAEERAMIAKVTEVLTRPTGWLGPWISQSALTPDLLKEAGYSYHLDWCHDDLPCWFNTAYGPLLSVPYPQELNDIPTIMVRRASARDFSDMIVDNLDEMLEQTSKNDQPPLVMGIALHGYIVGQPFRLRHLKQALRHVKALSDSGQIWLATAGQIADAYVNLDPPPSS